MEQDGGRDLEDVLGELRVRATVPLASAEEKDLYRRLRCVDEPAVSEYYASAAALRPSDAVRLLSRAAALAPADFRIAMNLANALTRSGVQAQALVPLKKAAVLVPEFARPYSNLAALGGSGRQRRAWHDHAWVAGALTESGISHFERLVRTGRKASATELSRRLLPGAGLFARFWRQRAALQAEFEDIRGAQRDHCRAVLVEPGATAGYFAAFEHFLARRRLQGADRLLRLAGVIEPSSLSLTVNRGTLCESRGEPEKAMHFALSALIRQPGNAARYYNLGSPLHDLGREREALTQLRRARLIAPEDLRFRNNLAISLLKCGRYREGFAEYEYRWYGPSPEGSVDRRQLHPVPSFDLPVWEPATDTAENVLLWGEQGVGDEIWGIGYLSHLRGRAESLAVEADHRLLPLLRRCFPNVTPIAREPEPGFDSSLFDAQLPLLSLPHALSVADIPAPSGWARAPEPERRTLRGEMQGEGGGRLVGLGWKSVKPLAHRSFDFDLGIFSELAGLGDVSFVPLQYGMSEQDWSELEDVFGTERIIRPEIDVWNDITGLAGMVSAMDLIVSAATMLVPLAVATGTPSAAILKSVQRDWRYAPGKEASSLLPGVTQIWTSPSYKGGKLLEVARTLLAMPVPGQEEGSVADKTRSRD